MTIFEEAHEAFEEGKGAESNASFKFSVSHATVIKKVKGQVLTLADVSYGLRIHDATSPVPVGPKDDGNMQLDGLEDGANTPPAGDDD